MVMLEMQAEYAPSLDKDRVSLIVSLFIAGFITLFETLFEETADGPHKILSHTLNKNKHRNRTSAH